MTEDNKKLAAHKPKSRVMMIQETESELKMIVKKAHMEGHSRRQLSHDTYTAIYRLIRELDNEELARKCAISFPRYVNKLNNEYSEVFRLLQAMPVTPRYASPDTEIVVEGLSGKIRTVPRVADIPDYAFDRGVAAQKFGEDYIKEVRLRLRNVAALAAKEDYASNVSLRNVAEMQIRYEKHLDDLDLLKSKGTKLVWISTHANCSARCAPYQGKLYSLDGTSGTTPDGVPYEPLEKATDVYYTTKAGVRYKNGLFGFNCRHEMTEYTPGSKPITIPDAVVKRQREIEKTQREFERAIRYERTLYEVSRGLGHKETDRLSVQAYHRKVELNKQYKEFCLKNDLAYPAERVQIFKDTELDIFNDKLLSKNKLTGREKTLVNYLTTDENRDTIITEFSKHHIIPNAKLVEYALNPSKEPNKALAFKNALGYDLSNYEDLKQNLILHINPDKFVKKGDAGFGMRYEYIIELTGANGKTANVLTAWIQDGDKRRLTSLYVTKRRVTE